MTLHVFLIVLGLGSAAIAFWWDARFPALAPSEYRIAMARIVTAIFVGSFLVHPVLEFVAMIEPAEAKMLAILGVGMTALVYAFLSGIWVIKLTHALVARHSK